MKRARSLSPLYIKLYDDTGTENREPLEAYMRSIVQMLRAEGLISCHAGLPHQGRI